MIIDDDAYFEEHSGLEKLVRYMQHTPHIAIAVCNIRGPAEGPAYVADCAIRDFKSGFAIYRREIFTDHADYFPDVFFRDAGEAFLANRLYDSGHSIAMVKDVWIYHWQTNQGRYSKDVNFFAVRSHALIPLLQEPLSIIPLSLGSKFLKSFLSVAVRRRDPISWFAGWCSFAAMVPWALRERRPISLRTYRYLRGLHKQAWALRALESKRSATGSEGPDVALAG